MLKLIEYDILFQEVPDEISLGLSFSGCPQRCKGCHSPHLRDSKLGENFSTNELDKLIKKYKGMISCILFFGGDWDEDSLNNLLVRTKEHHIKTCLYSGSDKVNINLLSHLDYLKQGPYIEELGPLNNPNTNQRMYKNDGRWIDITNIFWRKIGGDTK